jgi:hypothetical protein
MVSARRRVGVFGVGDTPQFYLAPRESRHIRGRSRVSYQGILLGSKPKDMALLARSNFDIKGLASSDWVLGGYVEKGYTKNYEAPLPLSSWLPQGLEQLLVIGKAYDISHDALSLARMERDMIAMGGSAALAAWISMQRGKPLSKIPVKEFHKGLLKLGVLEAGDLSALGKSAKPGKAKLKALAMRLGSGKASLPEEVLLLSQGKACLPLLRGILRADPDNAPAAQALCFLGDSLGLDPAIRRLTALCSKGLPLGKLEHHSAPDHGWSPEPCYWIAVASRLRDPALVPALEAVAALVQVDPKRCDESFDYIHALAYAAERLATPRALPFLSRLAALPGIQKRDIPFHTDFRKSVDWVADRHAYLELCLGRAMARCGSAAGYAILKRYLGDQRGFLVRSAKDELAALAKIPGLKPKPYLKEHD